MARHSHSPFYKEVFTEIGMVVSGLMESLECVRVLAVLLFRSKVLISLSCMAFDTDLHFVICIYCFQSFVCSSISSCIACYIPHSEHHMFLDFLYMKHCFSATREY